MENMEKTVSEMMSNDHSDINLNEIQGENNDE